MGSSSETDEEPEEPKQIDWGEVYARLLDIGLRYDEIPERSLKQVKILLSEWADITSLKISAPNIFGPLPSTTSQNNDGPPKVSQFADIANMFSGI